MVVQCSSCLTEFELDPRKLPSDGVRARCSVCSAVIVVPAPPQAQEIAPKEAPAQGEQTQAATGDETSSELTEARTDERVDAGADAQQPDASTSQPSTTQPGPATERPAAEAEPEHHVQADAASPASGPAGSLPADNAQNAPGVQRRPINPFLTRDPALRAKRLARALVSDIVAYHPARHAEGLRDGTLKTLFRDEIKKSYEEYVDQVGRDFAGTTTHFQDALNDVLASGKKLF